MTKISRGKRYYLRYYFSAILVIEAKVFMDFIWKSCSFFPSLKVNFIILVVDFFLGFLWLFYTGFVFLCFFDFPLIRTLKVIIKPIFLCFRNYSLTCNFSTIIRSFISCCLLIFIRVYFHLIASQVISFQINHFFLLQEIKLNDLFNFVKIIWYFRYYYSYYYCY